MPDLDTASALVHVHVPSPLATIEGLAERAAGYAADARARATRRAYAGDWRRFAGWVALQGLAGDAALPAAPALVAVYLAHLADSGQKPSTIARALVSIAQVHKRGGHTSPCATEPVPSTMKGIRARLGTAPAQKAPAVIEMIRAMVGTLEADAAGVRDRALLTLGFAAICRSELVALDVADLSWTVDGLEVWIRRSKTDQEGRGRKVGIPYGGTPTTCPVRAVRRWLDAAALTTGPVFRRVGQAGAVSVARLSDRAVALIVKRTARAAGLDDAPLSGHSLRAGFATTAAKAGKSERSIMAQTGHRSAEMVRRYIRDANLFTDNAAAGIGL